MVDGIKTARDQGYRLHKGLAGEDDAVSAPVDGPRYL